MFVMIYYYRDNSITTGMSLPFKSDTISKFCTAADMFGLKNYTVKNDETGEIVFKSDRYRELELIETDTEKNKTIVNGACLSWVNAQPKMFSLPFGMFRFEIRRLDITEDVYTSYGRMISGFLNCVVIVNGVEHSIRIDNYISSTGKALFKSFKKWYTINELQIIRVEEFKAMVDFYKKTSAVLEGIVYNKNIK